MQKTYLYPEQIGMLFASAIKSVGYTDTVLKGYLNSIEW